MCDSVCVSACVRACVYSVGSDPWGLPAGGLTLHGEQQVVAQGVLVVGQGSCEVVGDLEQTQRA